MKKIILLSFSSLVLITSCKKQDAVQPNPTVEVSTVGSEQKTEVESFLTTYYTAKTNILVDKADASSISSFYSDNSEAYKWVQSTDRVRLVRKNRGLTYNLTHLSISLNSIVALNETTFKCTVTESVKYSITGLNIKPEEQNLFEVTVEKRNGNYFIQKEIDTELEAMRNYQDPSVVDAEEIQGIEESSDFSKAAYNRSNAVWFAHEWWNRKHPSYYYFGHEGGNCTNYVSQCLKFGGWADASGASSNAKSWWYKSNGAGAYPSFARSWPSAHYFYVMLSKSPSKVSSSRYRYLDNGDIVQFKYAGKSTVGHSMLVTGTCVSNNEPFIWVSYHSVGEPWDRGKKDRLLDEMEAWQDNAVTKYYWKVK